jgi:hypothetical protein
VNSICAGSSHANLFGASEWTAARAQKPRMRIAIDFVGHHPRRNDCTPRPRALGLGVIADRLSTPVALLCGSVVVSVAVAVFIMRPSIGRSAVASDITPNEAPMPDTE